MNSFPSRSPTSWFLRGFSLLAAVGLAGCGDRKIEVYQLAKEQPDASSSSMSSMPPGHPPVVAPAGMPKLQWKLPAGWEQAAPGEMRAASFKVAKDSKQAEISAVPLPGLVGHDLENVNRWRGTVGLPPVKEEDLSKLAEPVQIGAQTGQLYDQAGENPGSGDKTRILVAVLRREGTAWFFKMSGDDALVADQKPVFLDFLKSLSFPPAAISTDLPPSHPPIDSAPMMSSQMAVTTSSDSAHPSWTVPAGWQEVPAGQFLVAKFAITGADNSQAAVNVSRSAGTGGGLAMNVNRWRGQIGLAPVGENDLQLQSLDTPGGKASLVDMTGTDARTSQKARVIGAIIPHGDETWFYKLMGNPDLVQKQKDAFTQFVQGAK